MIVEVRTYKIAPGRRAEFLDFFRERSIPALREHGMRVLGPLIDLEDPDAFVWLRIFPDFESRERLKRDFYEGASWKTELEGIAMPMLASYQSTLCETAAGFVDDFSGDGGAA